MKIAIIGAGLIGQERIAALKRIIAEHDQKFIISIVIDTDSDKLNQVKEKFGCEVSTDLNVISKYQPDWIFICTPHKFVYSLAKIAFNYGCNVFIEKPLGRSLEECCQIIDLKPSHSRLAVGFNYRFYNGIRQSINDALNGYFGQLISVNMILGHGNAPGMEKSWKLNYESCGGGALIDPGIHLLDLVLCLAKGEIKVMGGTQWSGFWNSGIEEEVQLLLKDTFDTTFNIQTSLNRWRSTFRLEINGTDGYGIVFGRGRSYGPQTYITGKRWGWQSGISQMESEKTIVEADPVNDSFYLELCSLFSLIVDSISINHPQLGVSNEIQALKSMDLLDRSRKSVNLPIYST